MSSTPKFLQINFHYIKLVEHFISFLKSPRSSKSEFGAKDGAAKMGMLQGVAMNHPRSSGATALGVALHTKKGGATPQARLRIGYKFSYIFRHSNNPNLLFSSPFLLQVDPNQLQQLLLCKCANTTKSPPSCACVLAFHKHFNKELALFSPRHSILATMQS
jgi:hypothetical protein